MSDFQTTVREGWSTEGPTIVDGQKIAEVVRDDHNYKDKKSETSAVELT